MSFDYFDHYRLRSIEQSLQHLRKTVATPNPFAPKQGDVEALQREVGELRLLVAVLYRLLLDKGQCSETEVNAHYIGPRATMRFGNATIGLGYLAGYEDALADGQFRLGLEWAAN